MKNYWDLSERERSQLTEEEVTDLEKYELMRAGVVRFPGPEPFLDESPALEKETAWAIRGDRYGSAHIVFLDESKARAALSNGALQLLSDYETKCDYVKGGLEVVGVSVVTERTFLEHKAALKAFAQGQNEHNKLVSDWDARERECDKALNGLREDWIACRETARLMDRISATMDDYVALSGDEDLARQFLKKAFPSNELRDAERWFDVDFTSDMPPVCLPMEAEL